MNILQISSAGSIGGGERHLIDLIDGLVQRGHTVRIAVRPRSALEPHFSSLPSGQRHALPLRNALDLSSARALRRLVREHNIDIVHAHLARDYPLAAFAAGGSPKCRLILTRHVLFPVGRFGRMVFRRAATVIAVSAAVRKALVESEIVSESRVRVIHNGIDLDRFDDADHDSPRQAIREQLGIGEQTRLLGSVGSLVPLKGHEDLIRAAALVAANDGEVHFAIIGDERPGDHATPDRLRALIESTGLSGRVHLLRRVPDVVPWLRAFDLFVSASHTESFGLAIVEAMATGCAVVATATAGASEVLDDGVTGRLTPVGDVPALADSIAQILADGSLREWLGAQAKLAAHARFSVDRMVDETVRVYREVMNRVSLFEL